LHLVDLLATLLVDSGIQTDSQLQLYHDIEQILRGAHEALHGTAGLVDPNLHTDIRLRLHHETAAILSTVGRQT
jgi:hypothetical protein